VNTAGDVNGDGYDDIAAGANLGGEGGIGYLVLGSADGIGSDTLGNAATRVVGSPGAGLGLAVSGGGDMDGDGLDDALFGAPPWQNHAGVSVVIFGEAQLPPTVSMEDAWLVQSGNNGGHQGEALYLGDVTGDGLADLFLGVPQAGSQAGVAALIVAGAY
jgi:hypothetical protein